MELSVRQLTAAAYGLGVRITPTVSDDGVVIERREAEALTRAIQQKDDMSIDGNHARRLLAQERPLDIRETSQLTVAINRVVTAAHRADKLRRGQIPGALSSREVTDLYRRGFIR